MITMTCMGNFLELSANEMRWTEKADGSTQRTSFGNGKPARKSAGLAAAVATFATHAVGRATAEKNLYILCLIRIGFITSCGDYRPMISRRVSGFTPRLTNLIVSPFWVLHVSRVCADTV